MMKSIGRALVVTAMSAILANTITYADDHHDNAHYVRHDEWKKGGSISRNDWNRGEKIDYRHYHLNAPPHGYEWRQVDGNFVLAAVATGLISSVVIASTAH